MIQYLIKSDTLLLLIISLVISGSKFLKYSLAALAYKEPLNLKMVGHGLLGAGFLV